MAERWKAISSVPIDRDGCSERLAIDLCPGISGAGWACLSVALEPSSVGRLSSTLILLGLGNSSCVIPRRPNSSPSSADISRSSTRDLAQNVDDGESPPRIFEAGEETERDSLCLDFSGIESSVLARDVVDVASDEKLLIAELSTLVETLPGPTSASLNVPDFFDASTPNVLSFLSLRFFPRKTLRNDDRIETSDAFGGGGLGAEGVEGGEDSRKANLDCSFGEVDAEDCVDELEEDEIGLGLTRRRFEGILRISPLGLPGAVDGRILVVELM